MEHKTLGLQTLAEARDKKSTGFYIQGKTWVAASH